MTRYIDADDFLDLFYVASAGQDKAFIETVEMVVADTPTADVVEVVRCRDCKHRVEGSKICAHPKAVGWDAIEPEDDDFCSYGERRTE